MIGIRDLSGVCDMIHPHPRADKWFYGVEGVDDYVKK